jgi:hypothetical protein
MGNNTSKYAFFFIFTFYLVSIFCFKNWGDFMLDRGDTHGFYSYLPAIFIHNDLDNLKISTLSRISNRHNYDRNYTPETVPDRYIAANDVNGKKVILWNCGVAVLQAPFFALSHIFAKILGYRADGYSLPYRLGMMFGNLLYVMLGFWFSRQVLKLYVKDTIVAFALISLAFATNLYFFTVFNPFMAHSYLFFLFAALIYTTVNFYKNHASNLLVIMGFIIGLIVLTRPPDVWVVIIPMLFGLKTKQDIIDRFRLIWLKKSALILAFLAFCLPISLQLFYWKYITGNWIYYFYGEVGFDFTKPHLIVGLFSFKNGWLTYTPVMILAILGLFLKRKHDFLWASLIFSMGYIYTIYSWQILYYINGFGSRPMVETYALLVIPLSICLDLWSKKIWSLIPTLLFIFFCTWLNIIQTYQFSKEILISEISNFAFWRTTLGKTKLDKRALVSLDSDEYQPETPPQYFKVLYQNNFQDSTNGYLELKKGAFSNMKILKGKDIKGHRFLRFSLKANSPDDEKIFELFRKSLIVAHFKSGEKEIKYSSVKIENKLGNDSAIFGGKTNMWDEVIFYVNIPTDLKDEDDIACYLWNNNQFNLLIDDVKQELCD